MSINFCARALASLSLAVTAPPALANFEQNPLDRADPSVVEEELREETQERPTSRPIFEAPPPQAVQSALGAAILVGAIQIDGADAIDPGAFAPVIERYAARMLSPVELKALASEIQAVAHQAGYGLATAWIPRQRVANGVLRVNLDEGRIDAVEVSGTAAAAVEPYLRDVADGKPVRINQLERQLLLADDLPGVRLGKARLQRRGARNILAIDAKRERIEAQAGLDNWGSSTAGPLRARLSVDINALVTDDDCLSIDGLLTPLDPAEFGLVRLVYSMAVGTGGTELSIGGYIARSEAGGSLDGLDIDGSSSEIEAGLRHPIFRSRSGSLWGGITGRLRESHHTRADAPLREDSLTTLTASLYGTAKLSTGRVRGRAALVRGVDLFGATDRGDLLSSRRDADGTFSKAELWGEFEQRFDGGFSFLAQAEGQVADGALLSSEEMGLGGRYFGRAWDYREFAGDRGVAGAVELRFDWKKPTSHVRLAQLYVYADAGAVDNYGTGTGGGSLASSGGGVRLGVGRSLRAGVELGVPLTDGADPSKEDNPRLSFTIDKRF
jgi:hemolysin activation/secretion protein